MTLVAGVRRAFANVATLLVAVTLSLGVVEVALRIHNPFAQRVRFGSIVLPVNRVESMRNDHVPGVPALVVEHRNALGFRGADPPADLERRLSIVTIGGSTTEASYEPDGATWTDLLGTRLGACFPDLWINNAGLDGHTTYGHLSLMRDHIARLRPRVAIFLLGANDRWARAPSTSDREIGIGAVSFGSLKATGKSVAARLETAALAVTLYRALRGWWVGAWYEYVDWAHAPEGEPYPADAEAVLLEHRSTRVPQYESRLEALVTTAREAGIAPIFVTQPIVLGPAIDPTTGKDLRRVLHGTFEWERLELYNEALRRVAQRREVPLVDLARRMPHDTALFFDTVHYTTRGEEMVAEIVFEEVQPILAALFPADARGDCRAARESATAGGRT